VIELDQAEEVVDDVQNVVNLQGETCESIKVDDV
jgi:hypothetical protein